MCRLLRRKKRSSQRQSLFVFDILMTKCASAAGAQVFDQRTEGKNWQGSIEKVTKDNNIQHVFTWYPGEQTNRNRNDNNQKNENFHEHYNSPI